MCGPWAEVASSRRAAEALGEEGVPRVHWFATQSELCRPPTTIDKHVTSCAEAIETRGRKVTSSGVSPEQPKRGGLRRVCYGVARAGLGGI